MLDDKLAQGHQKMMKTHDLHRNKQTDNFKIYIYRVDGGNYGFPEQEFSLTRGEYTFKIIRHWI